jgi:hypothetical protein
MIVYSAIYKGLANQLQIGETASIPELQTTISFRILEIILNFQPIPLICKMYL